MTGDRSRQATDLPDHELPIRVPNRIPNLLSRPVLASPGWFQKSGKVPEKSNTGGPAGTSTDGTRRFWRPVLYQLSYTPKVTGSVCRSPRCAVSSIGAGRFARAKRQWSDSNVRLFWRISNPLHWMPCSRSFFSVKLVLKAKAKPGLPANQEEQRERR